MANNWPPEISITLDNYSESTPDRVVRSTMEVGPAKIRRRSSANVRQINLSLFINDTLLQMFDDFYLANDSLVFNFVDPRTGVSKRARFNGAPTYNRNQKMWAVGVKLEYLP